MGDPNSVAHFATQAMFISSPANPTVRSLHALASAKEREKSGLFLVEGVRAVSEALAANHLPRVCLYATAPLERTKEGRALLGKLDRLMHNPSAGIMEATERAVEAAGDTVHTQGIVAAFDIPRRQVAQLGSPTPLAVVCDDIQDPGNLGTILRTAEAAGAGGVWLTGGCADVFSPKVVRSAMGAHFRLPLFPDRSWEQIGAELRGCGVGPIYAAEAEARTSYDAVDWTLPAALIVSNEARGLSPEAVAFAGERGELISIPMQGGTESLNAAMACAVILFEAARQRRASPPRA